MWFWAVVLRLVFAAAPFDIYFTSPLVRGGPRPVDLTEMPPSLQNVLERPPARRLVLFVADGFRYSSFDSTDKAPYLKSIVKDRGSWGVSHTRIPTESRPGHVAIIAGFYEDPSAITKGWKENPIEFDSLFNRSRRTWSWGSPDILPMFAKGATGDRVHTESYSHTEEDFSGKISTSKLDTWVFDRVEKMFAAAQTDRSLYEKLHDDKIVFFLHLLGLDTAGHTHKPHSSLYSDNIKTVNDGVQKIEKIIENFYKDDKTAFIFTADHGMTDWGSHGAGSDDETETPFLAWGAGIHSTKDSMKTINHIEQADICPLMASLIGIDIPFDSVGLLPDKYINVSDAERATYLYKNTRQLLTQYNHKRAVIENNAVSYFFKPFEELSEIKIHEIVKSIENLIASEKYPNAMKKCKDVMKTALIGLNYFQNYYQNILLFSMTLSYFGWIFWLATALLESFQINKLVESFQIRKSKKYKNPIDFIFGLLSVITTFFIFVQSLPIQYYVYFNLPIFLWWKVISHWNRWHIFFNKLSERISTVTIVFKFTALSFLYIAGLAILVMAFFQRWVLSISLFGLAIYPLFNHYRQHISKTLLFVWIFTCISLSAFSFLPVIGKHEDKHLVGVAALLWFISSMTFLFRYSIKMLKSNRETKRENLVMVVPPVLMIMAIQVKYFVSLQFERQQGVWTFCQAFSWFLSAISLIVPLFSSKWIISRLFTIKTALAIVFILLSVSHEGLFLLTLAINLFCWLAIEHSTSGLHRGMELSQFNFDDPENNKKSNFRATQQRTLTLEDLRRSYIFLLYIILSFFGTGNIASINSFDPQWVRCFVTQFSPFTMTALILSKTLIPFLFVSCTLCAVNIVVKAPTSHLLSVVLIYSDLMGLAFLHMITNKGSWLDIGTSISHYIIMESTVFFVSLLYGIGQLMTRKSLWLSDKERLKKY